MSSYSINFTDSRSFIIQPYTANGPTSPIGGVDPAAATATTTLYLYGKFAPNYGERLQENLVNILENFFGAVEPSFPIPGQLWFNSSILPHQLFVFNPRKYQITSNINNTITVTSVNGLETLTEVEQYFATLAPTRTIRVLSNTNSFIGTYTVTAVPGSGTGNITVAQTTVSGALVGHYIGGWQAILQNNTTITLTNNLNANGRSINNLATPINPGDATNKQYVDSVLGVTTLDQLADVAITTPSIGNALIFNGVNWVNSALGAFYLEISGGTMSGSINMAGNQIINLFPPIVASNAATKAYVDNQQLSDVNVNIIAPATNHILAYDAGVTAWINKTPTAAGILSLLGGTMNGPLNMGANPISNVAFPAHPADAATKQYVDNVAGGTVGIVTHGSFDQNTGTLALVRNVLPTVLISGFLPTPNNAFDSQNIRYQPLDLGTPPNETAPGLFWHATMGDLGVLDPFAAESPTSIKLDAALDELNFALGNYAVPRQRLVINAPVNRTIYNLFTGSGLGVLTPPEVNYVVGSNNLQIYINGVKQIASTHGSYTITNFNATTTAVGDCIGGGNTIHVAGDITQQFRPGVQFSITGTSTTNDGDYIITSAVPVIGPITILTVQPNIENNNEGTIPFVLSGAATIVHTGYGIRENMETGYLFATGTPDLRSISVAVNGLPSVNIIIDTDTINVTTIGLLLRAINEQARHHFINKIVGVTPGGTGTLVVSGNRTAQFTMGTQFTFRFSTNNNGIYTVLANATYNSITNQTTITTVEPITDGTVNGVIFKDRWGFAARVLYGKIVFLSNLSGAGSSVVVTDPGIAGLITGITGGSWALSFSSTPSLGQSSTPVLPTTRGYTEYGIHGYLSSIVEFTNALTSSDVIEFIVDREMIYTPIDPFDQAATI